MNRLVRAALCVVGFLAAFTFFAFEHQAKFEGARHTTHTRFGLESSPWFVMDTERLEDSGNVTSGRRSNVYLGSWSWVGLGVSIAAFWARRRFTPPEPSASRAA